MAIDIILEHGYDHTVDFWSLGVILYELLFGITPFTGDTIIETFQKLQNFRHYLVIPPPEDEDDEDDNDIVEDSDTWRLITRLIADPEERLGHGKSPQDGINDIKAHPFFKDTDFDTIIKTEDVPFHPKLDNEMDISYFKDAIDEEDFDSMASSTLEDIINMPKEFTEPFANIIKKKKKIITP